MLVYVNGCAIATRCGWAVGPPRGVKAPRAQAAAKELNQPVPPELPLHPQSSVLKVRLRPAYVTSQVDHYRVSSVCPRMMYFRRRMVRHSYMSVCGLRLFVPSDGLVVVYLLTDRPGSGTGPRQSPIGLLQTSRTTPKSTVGMQGPSPIAADRPGSGTGPRQTPTCNPPSTCSSCLLAMSLAAPASGALPPSRW